MFNAPTPPGGRPLDNLITELLSSTRQLLGMEVAFVSEFHEGRRVFRYGDAERGFAPIQVNDSDLLQDSYCQRVVDGRLPELMVDATRDPEALTLPATLAVPIGAHLSVPIRLTNGRVFGTLCCFSRQPDTSLSHRDMETMRFFAEILGKVLEEREDAQAAWRQVRGRMDAVLTGHEFSTVFQPIWDIRENKVVGFEALSRFKGMPYRPPNEWIDDAESVGVLQDLEALLHHNALQHVDDLPEGAYLSLNVTPASLLGADFAAMLETYPLDRIVLEITEHESITDYDRIESALEPLRRRGLRLAVDDAGAGYASFRHILRLKADIIKLDRSLIRDIDADVACRTLAQALVQFAGQVGSRVIAEGVETKEELEALRGLGIVLVQGYLLGQPQPGLGLGGRLAQVQ